MSKLIYSMITSLDGYVADAQGNFDWAEPDEEELAVINDQERSIGTYLYGRRMYEMLAVWETDPSLGEQTPTNADFAKIWKAADKVVFSTTLEKPVTARTRIERAFDPEAIRQLKRAATQDLTVAGPELAGHALKAGLVDEVRCFVAPVAVGGGTPFLPRGLRLDLETVEEHRFSNGVVYLRYRNQT